MKKFIAGVVLTVVAFMALTTGVLAKSGSGGGNLKQASDRGGSNGCTAYEYYVTTSC